MKTKFTAILIALIVAPLFSAYGAGIAKNNAKMQAMDKITGRVSVINVPVGGKTEFGSLSIVVRSCKTRPAEETPDNFAFADITDKTLKGEEFNIFKGWMISSSPATHAVEHPIYDVWLLQCTDEKIDEKNLLSEKELAIRDTLPMTRNLSDNKSKSAADEAQDNLELTQTISEMENEQPQTPEVIQPQAEFFYDEEESTEETNELLDTASSAELVSEKSEEQTPD